MKLVYIINKEFCCSERINIISGRNEVCHLGKPVHNNEDSREFIGWRETDNEVHRNRTPRAVGNGERLQVTEWFMKNWLASIASVTRGNVIKDELAHVRPVIVARDEFKCLGTAIMSSRRRVVVVSEDAKLKVIIIGNVQEAIVQNEVIVHGIVFQQTR